VPGDLVSFFGTGAPGRGKDKLLAPTNPPCGDGR
jgi:hypothetical protein